MASKESLLRVKLIGGDPQGLDATTLARRSPGSNLLKANNVVPERGVMRARKAYTLLPGPGDSELGEPRGLKVCLINGKPVIFAAWVFDEPSGPDTVRVYRFEYPGGPWSEVTGSGKRFLAAVQNPIRFAQVKAGAEDIVLMSNGVEDVLAYHIAENQTRRQYYVERPEEDKLRIWYKPYSFGNTANGWFQLVADASYPAYSADDHTKFKLLDAGTTWPGDTVGNGVTIQLQASNPSGTDGLKTSVQLDATGLDFRNGYQLIFHVDSPSILLTACKIEIGNGNTPTWTTIYHPTDVTAYDRIDVNGNWIALSVRNVPDANKNAVKHIRFTWLSNPNTVFLLTFAGFRLGGKVSATTAYSSTYYDSVNRQESAPGAPQSSVPKRGLAGWWPGLYVGSEQLPFDPNFFYVFACVHYASSQSTVDKARIYRQTPEGEWRHVGDVNDNGGSLDDNTPDLELVSSVVRPLPGLIPVPPGRFIEPAANRLVSACVVLPVPAAEETIRTTTALTGSPQSVSATAQPKRPCRLRIVGTAGTETGTVTFTGLDTLGRGISESVSLNGTNPVETKMVFASLVTNGIALPAGSGSVIVTSGSYAAFTDRWYISRGDDPLRFTRVPTVNDVWTGSWAATGGHAITGLEVLQAGTGDRIIVFTADGNAYIYEGMDVSSLTTARERVPVPGVAPYATCALPNGIAFVDAQRLLRVLGAPPDLGYPVQAALESAVDSSSMFAAFTGRDLYLTYRDQGAYNNKAIILDLDRMVWKQDVTRVTRHTVSAVRTGSEPQLFFQATGGELAIPHDTVLDADLTTSPTEWLGVPVEIDTGTVDLAGTNRSATVFGIWAEFDGILRKIGALNQWSGTNGNNYIEIGYDVRSDIIQGVTKVAIDPSYTVWRKVTGVTFSGGVTRVTFDGPPIVAGDDRKNPRFSLDVKFTITAVPSQEVYTVTRAFTGSKRHQLRHAVRTDTRFRASAMSLKVETITHSDWALYAAGIEMEPQEIDPYE